MRGKRPLLEASFVYVSQDLVNGHLDSPELRPAPPEAGDSGHSLSPATLVCVFRTIFLSRI